MESKKIAKFCNLKRILILLLVKFILCHCQQSSHSNEADLPKFENGIYETVQLKEGSSTPHLMKCLAHNTQSIFLRREGNTTLKMLGLQVFEQSPDEEGDPSTRFKIKLLTFNSGNKNYEGIYKCRASNQYGSIDKVFNVTVLTKSDSSSNLNSSNIKTNNGSATTPTTTAVSANNNNNVIAGVSVTIAVVTLLLVWILYEFFGGGKNGLTKEEIQEFLLGNAEAIRSEAFAHENAAYMPYKNSYEVIQDKLYIDRNEMLGSGQYGEVFKGRYNNHTVAVKTVKPNADKMYLKSLLAELKIMIYLGSHPNLVSLVGASTNRLSLGQLYIIVDCCEFGSLESYLRKYKNQFVNQMDINGIVIKQVVNGKNELCTKNFILWSHQIAKAMDFLGSKKVIHGDLATRNVLLSDRYTAKITDFGLSRQLYDYTPNYVKQNMEPLPWRWMAYESLRELSFSTSSDVWSYGVTLWELFSLAEVPYAGLYWTKEFVDSLLDNYRLPKPNLMSHNIYCEVIKCWNIEPSKRPSFKQMQDYFQGFFGAFSIPYDIPRNDKTKACLITKNCKNQKQ